LIQTEPTEPTEQNGSESHSESESDQKEKDRKELVSQRSRNQPCSKAAQKKQKVSVTDPKSEEVMKLVNEMCVHHVQTMFAIDYSNHFIFTGT
jgi:hypothetical protein